MTEIAKLGQLYLQNGEWNGKQLISKQWVDNNTKPQIKTGEDNPDKTEYSYLFWQGQYNSYRADGKYGQFSIVFPAKNAVLAINAYNRGEGNILNCLWKYLYPVL